MKFRVNELKLLTKMVQFSNTDDEVFFSDYLRKRQPGFDDLIDEVRIDPRCLYACRFCTLFCSAALEHAERLVGESFPSIPRSVFHETVCMIAQRQEAIGKRASTYPDRIRRYVLAGSDFDDDDSGWLQTTISAFLITLEKFQTAC